ncbi:MAG: endonuclease NucS [Candidatus Thermoplasmatota archaeon]|jgi:RecB family endonuclease NucS|nr:endonuclease NucS [Candidatus Thermoplasmatota archaeon]
MMINNIVNPTPKMAIDFIKIYHKSKPDKTMLVLIGDCMIDYHGRARSLLDWGERIIMIKQDGTVLVHQPVMREPVNWQPAGTKTDYSIENNHLVLKTHHKNPPEKMTIKFRDIKLVVTTSLKDKAKLVIAGMETDVVNQITKNPDIIEEGLRISKREKHIKSGVIDLFGYDKNHTPVVIEVKRSLANISAAQQLRMYVNDIKKDVDEANVRGILCAPRVPDLVKKLLSDYNLEWREIERQIVLPDELQKTLKEF